MKSNYHSPWAKVHHGRGTKLAFITSYDPNREHPFRGVCFKGPWLKNINLTYKGRPLNPYKTVRNLDVIAVWSKCPSPHSFLHPGANHIGTANK